MLQWKLYFNSMHYFLDILYPVLNIPFLRYYKPVYMKYKLCIKCYIKAILKPFLLISNILHLRSTYSNNRLSKGFIFLALMSCRWSKVQHSNPERSLMFVKFKEPIFVKAIFWGVESLIYSYIGPHVKFQNPMTTFQPPLSHQTIA